MDIERREAEEMLVPVVRLGDSDVNVRVDIHDSVLVLVKLAVDEVSLSEKLGSRLVKVLWTVKFNDTVPLVELDVLVSCGGEDASV